MGFFVVGVGASGEFADDLVDAGIAAIADEELLTLRGQSRRHPNPAWGGATRAPFVNAAVVVETVLPPGPLLQLLFTIERRFGRLRAQKNGARTLDLDVLWSPTSSSSSSTPATPTLPHPRLLERSFAVIPAVEAMNSARLTVPLPLARAAAHHRLALP